MSSTSTFMKNLHKYKYANTFMYSEKQDVGKLQGCFYFGNGINHNLSQVQQIQDGGLSYLRLLSFHSKDKEISHVINNIECICSLAAHSLSLKCFMIDLEPI